MLPPGVHSPDLIDKALGSYLGLAVGDALGATVEFMTSREIIAEHRVHQNIIGGGWLRLKPGQVTDDTEMSLALGEAIIRHPEWNLNAVGDAFVRWMRKPPVDIGNTCRRGIRRYMQTGALQGQPGEDEGGNGAAMRNLPVVIANLHHQENLHFRSLAQAHITHWHPCSDAAILSLADMTRDLIFGSDLLHCSHLADTLVREHPVFRFRPYPRRTSGYIVDTLQTVFDAFFHTDNFEDCLVTTVNRGGDSDTTGALAGQLAGALYGASAIPSRWLHRLDPAVKHAVEHQTQMLLTIARQAAANPL